MRAAIVIGHFNAPDFLELNLRAIREHCGEVPVLVADDCSDGSSPEPDPASPFGQVRHITETIPGVTLWPNTSRIGHAGGDLSAFWKGLHWAQALGYEVLFKLSQRLVIDRAGWLTEALQELDDADAPVLGKACEYHGWRVRTESIGLRVAPFLRDDILSQLVPRPLECFVEQIFGTILQKSLGDRLAPWSILSTSRNIAAPGLLFRATHTPDDYRALARRLGMSADHPFTCARAKTLPNYQPG